MLLTPAQAQVRIAEEAGHAPGVVIRAAMQWRIGNAYPSYRREQYVISVLREHGSDVRCHVLADVLFRVDCWLDLTCVGTTSGMRSSGPRAQGGSRALRRFWALERSASWIWSSPHGMSSGPFISQIALR
jgi:hypothetical protein